MALHQKTMFATKQARSFYFQKSLDGRSVDPVKRFFQVFLKSSGRAGSIGLALLIVGFSAALLASSPEITSPTQSSDPKAITLNPSLPPGVAAAQTLSQVTGIAISPALGVGSLGAWKYFHTPATQRPQLPWFAQPWFWIPALVLVFLVLVKDVAGPVIPTALKKPFDVAELFENKFSALIATGAIIPLALSVFRSLEPNTASLAGAGLAVIDFSPLWNVLMVPIALGAYASVFLVSHVVHVLIVISPFGTVDAGLKALRLFVLATVAGTSFASPSLGAVWAGLIILCCLPLAGWAFRLLVFGHVFAWDFGTFHRHRRLPTVTDNRAFLATKLGRTPRRSYGKLSRNPAGELVFTFRPWLVLTPCAVPLPPGRYALGRGFFHPELLRVNPTLATDAQQVLYFPPRYSGHEPLLGQAYGITEIREVGLRAIWAWFRNLFRSGDPVPVVQSRT